MNKPENISLYSFNNYQMFIDFIAVYNFTENAFLSCFENCFNDNLKSKSY